ncbi:hypothetical protein [Nonomuraea rubra]|uniref:Asp23/Gls24 family envelope stress response protein n=1 Tax=Nonomuraea rubra TaxID=46180 RepID=A0A7X0NN84_9ACTN|nr:hypothetical protein [Nonomuraea rubra]MBB6546537.1 hypothetical protein [Nonomuraea rubra]
MTAAAPTGPGGPPNSGGPATSRGPTGPGSPTSPGGAAVSGGAASVGGGAGSGAATEERLIADRALGCRGVARLSGGPFGTVATYLPGERLTGVSADERAVEIAIVATLERPLPQTADEVRGAVADLAGDRPVHVRIDDIIVEGS